MSTLSPGQNERSTRLSSLQHAGLFVFLLFLILTLYTLLHESGHALVGLLFGGKITSFSVNFFNLSAHVGIVGEFTAVQQALISVAGVTLPVVLCMAFLLLASRNTEPVLSLFKLVLFMGTVNSMLAWIFIPVLVILGQTPSDDSYNFLNITHFHPLLVSAAALLVYLTCWYWFLRVMGGSRAVVYRLRHAKLELSQPAAQKSIRSLVAFGGVVGAVTLALTLAFPDHAFQAPAGYQMVAELQLSDSRIEDQAIYRFTLDEPASMSFYFILQQVKGGPVRIHLTGPDGFDNVFLRIEDVKTDLGQASVHPQGIQLGKGDYEIRVTFQPSQGRVRAYIKPEAPSSQ